MDRFLLIDDKDLTPIEGELVYSDSKYISAAGEYVGDEHGNFVSPRDCPVGAHGAGYSPDVEDQVRERLCLMQKVTNGAGFQCAIRKIVSKTSRWQENGWLHPGQYLYQAIFRYPVSDEPLITRLASSKGVSLKTQEEDPENIPRVLLDLLMGEEAFDSPNPCDHGFCRTGDE